MSVVVESTAARSADLDAVAARWTTDDLMARLWNRDPTVWFDPPRQEIDNRLGWLDLPTSSRTLVGTVTDLAAEARSLGITDVVLCGMGGSSLAPEVFAATLPRPEGSPKLTVIDTTHPDAVADVTARIDPATTWFVISSKSGGTLETTSLFHHFWSVARSAVSDQGTHFIAVTDPGSSLETAARDRGFRAVVLADPDVGGRYSALSAFGLVPVGITGVDIATLLDRGADAAHSCRSNVPLLDNPGFLIGATLGTSAARGSDIARFEAHTPLAALPVWIEQLIAESTGKEQRGIIPVADGPLPANARGVVNVSIGRTTDPDADIGIRVDDAHDVAAVMYILEFATAIAGEVIGIHPFDQPDVQLAKSLAHRAMEGSLPASSVTVYRVGDASTRPEITQLTDGARYVAIQAYVAPTPATTRALEGLRAAIVERLGVMTTTGYGPRFLHSTGQLHKGGPPGGTYVQIVDTPSATVAVEESDFSFNELIAGQAAGDRAALSDRDRHVLAFDIGTQGLESVAGALDELLLGDQ